MLGFLTKIRDKISASEYSVIEVIIHDHNRYSYNLLHVKELNKQLEILECIEKIESFDELKKHLSKDSPVLLQISGKALIARKLKIDIESDHILQTILPNADLSEFQVQTIALNNKEQAAFVIRKDQIKAIKEPFEESKLFVVDIKLGFSSIATLLPLLGIENQRIVCSRYQLTIKNNQVVNFGPLRNINSMDKVVHFCESEIPQHQIGLFSLVLTYVTGGKPESKQFNDAQNEFKAYKRIKLAVPLTLISVFLLLLINYFLFDHYYAKSNELENQIAVYADVLKRKEVLAKKVEQQNQLIKELGLDDQIQLSYSIDQLLNIMPASTRLTSFTLNPMQAKSKKKLGFIREKMIISGKTTSPWELNNWITSIDQFEWISLTTLSNYQFNEQNSSADFTIEITYINLN